MDAWILRLKAAFDAGYYKTEAAPGEQTPLPWLTAACTGHAARVPGAPSLVYAHDICQGAAQSPTSSPPICPPSVVDDELFERLLIKPRRFAAVRRLWRKLRRSPNL